jgi:hypothetical protein
MSDRERTLVGHAATNVRENGVDDTQRNARLQCPRDGPLNGQGVAVAATGDERPHDRVTIIFDDKRFALVPRQLTASFEAKLTTARRRRCHN